MFDIEVLVLFKLLHQTKSLSEAAALIPVSVSKASRMLALLREHFGDELFYRSSNLLYPTQKAEALLPRILKLIEDITSLNHTQAFDPKKEQCIFSVVCLDLDLVALVSPLLEELRHRAPGIKLNFFPIDKDFVRYLGEGRYDLAIYPTTLSYPGVNKQRLCEDTFVYICTETNSLAARAAAGEILSEEEVQRQLLVQVTTPISNSDNTYLGQYIRDVKNSVFNPALWTPFFATLPFLLTDNATTFLPLQQFERIRKHFPVRLLGRPAALEPYETTLLWPQRCDADPAHQWLRSFLISNIRRNTLPVKNIPTLRQ